MFCPVRSCQKYRDLGDTSSGIYTLSPSLGLPFKVYCEMDANGKGWTVLMRNDGQDAGIFNQNWAAYQNGFGDLNSNFWLGNEFLHQITKDKPHELHVDLRKAGTADTSAFYSGFQVFCSYINSCFFVRGIMRTEGNFSLCARIHTKFL